MSDTTTAPDRLAFFSDVPEIAAGDPPTSRIQVAKAGKFKHGRYGTFAVTRDTFGSFIRNLAAGIPTPELPGDFDHLPQQGGPTKACAWLKALHADGDRLFGDVEWTEDGAAAVRKREYRFISPTWHPNYSDDAGRKHGPTLIGFALTNSPFFDGMASVSLSRTFSRDQLPAGAELAVEDELTASERFADHWELASGYIRAEHRDRYRREVWERNAHLHGSVEGLAPLLNMGYALQPSWDDSAGLTPIHVGRVAFDAAVETYAAEHDLDPGQVDPDQALLAHRAQRLAAAESIDVTDALFIAAVDVDLSDARAAAGAAPTWSPAPDHDERQADDRVVQLELRRQELLDDAKAKEAARRKAAIDEELARRRES